MSGPHRYGPWALITGASDGIGQALATRIAAQGVHVVLVARNRARLDALAVELSAAHGVEALVVATDLTDPAGADDVEYKTRQLDIGLAVLAAGFGTTGSFVDSPLADELDMIAVNITAVTRLTHTFAQRMVARRGGGILLFGSIVGWQGVPGQAGYAATKAYVQNFAEGLHRELAPLGVDVLSVAPGPVDTGFGARAGLTMSAGTTADVVADASLRALGHRTTVVPGAQGKFLTASLWLLPRRLRSRILGRVIAGMRTPAPAAGQPNS